MKTCYCSRRVCTKNRAWWWNGLKIGTFLNVVSNEDKLCCWRIAGFISFPKVKITKFSEHMFFRFGLSFVFLCAALSAEKSLIFVCDFDGKNAYAMFYIDKIHLNYEVSK